MKHPILYAHRRQDAPRIIFRVLGALIVAATFTGCANTPKTRGIPWWPQGPGNTPENVAHTSAAAPSNTGLRSMHADTMHSSSTQSVDGYARAVRYGDLLFVSGQIAEDPTSLAIVGGDIEAQVHSAMDNVIRILESYGLTSSNILSVTLYLQDIDELPKADAVLASYFQRGLPGRSVVNVNGLPKGSLVEITVIAGK